MASTSPCPQGAITVLLGPSGAGKTVTIKHIVGLIQPSAGIVVVEGKDLAELTETELYELRRGMSAVLQGTLPFTCGLFYSLNVYENVAFALRARTRLSPEQVDQVTLDHLEMVGMRERADAMPDQLSAGMCKRTALARALALEARIVIIDDFDSGIDGVRLALLCDLIRDAQRSIDATFLVSTHDMTRRPQARRPRRRDLRRPHRRQRRRRRDLRLERAHGAPAPLRRALRSPSTGRPVGAQRSDTLRRVKQLADGVWHLNTIPCRTPSTPTCSRTS